MFQNCFKKKSKEEKERKKSQKEEKEKQKKNMIENKSKTLSNGEDEVSQFTIGGSNLLNKTAQVHDNVSPNLTNRDLLLLERLKQLELQVGDQNKDANVYQSKPSASTVQSSFSERITPEALRVLEDAGVVHTLAQKVFYLARLVSSAEPVHQHIKMYVENGQEHEYGMKVKNILRVVRDGDLEFHHQPERRDDFRLLLWHGTKKAAIASILENGFILPKQNGQMFGPGIYFADRASKSANYGDQGCNPKPGSTAFLFLCDVLLGNVYNAKKPHTEFIEAPNGLTKTFHSVKCTGEKVPDRRHNQKYHNSTISCGPTIKNTQFEKYTVKYNEFIVYKTENIRIMFLVEVEFAKEPVQESVKEQEDDNKNIVVPMITLNNIWV